MKNKIILTTLLSFASLIYADGITVDITSIIKEDDGNKKTHNEIDDNYDVQKGWDYYDDGQMPTTKKKKSLRKKNDIGEIVKLLREIKDENKAQTKIQTKILKILKDNFDPDPKIIMVDGEECVANSSSKCFDYASLLVPEAKKVPALKEFLSDPYSLDKAANYLQWQSKLFNHSFNTGNAIQMAVEQWGSKVNTLGTNRSSYNTTDGALDSTIRKAAEKDYIINLKDKISFNIYLGINPNLDIFSITQIAAILREYKDLNFNFYFKDKKALTLFKESMKVMYSGNNINWNKSKKIIDEEMFKTAGIYTSPSLEILYSNKDKNLAQIIATGRVGKTTFKSRVLNFLSFNKLMKLDELSDDKIWKKYGSKFTKDYYQRTYHVNINTSDVK